MNKINIKWLGHACFCVSANDYKIVLDPYQDGYVPGYDKIRESANLVLCSHEHNDHNARSTIKKNNATENPFVIETINTFHDDQNGSLRGQNIIHILIANELKIVHLGDLGCGLTADQQKMLEHTDVLLIPVGGTYTIDSVTANEIVNNISPRIVIPMHYRTEKYGYDVLESIASFTKLRDDVIYQDGNNIDVTASSPVGCIVLEYYKNSN